MTALHVFLISDVDYVVAADEDDAKAVFREYYGRGGIAVGGDPTMCCIDDEEIASQLEWLDAWPDDRPLKIWWNKRDDQIGEHHASDSEVVELPAGEWAQKVGRGWFCSTEF